ncbi:carnitine transporter [Marasmius crinis-equi]|uniref:Carnitine transporter n=1 Tax=Marasmius crinis-equi TaxID=585013 RepID=A0ABR3FZ49_9AGAR
MRLLSTILTTFPLLSFAAQVPFNTRPSSSFSKTLVDLLGEDPDYESLLQLIQRAQLVPTLNRLNGSTLFAPTNDAINRHRSSNPLWNSILEDPSFIIHDNVQEQLRQQLLYHLINSSVPTLPKESEPLQVLKTLHFPHSQLDPPTHDPPPYPPWLPIPGGTLGGEPQRLRVAARGQNVWVGVDAFGKKGSKVVKGSVNASNAFLFGIDEVLEPPADLGVWILCLSTYFPTDNSAATVVSHQPDVSYFHNVLTSEITHLLNSTPQLTVFLPVNKAWEALDEYERLYLESRYATDDLNMILNMHAVTEKRVIWSEAFEPAINLTTIDGTTLEVVVAPDKTMVSSATLVQPDIYAANGVLHFVDSLLTPPGAIKMTPEKYLLTLNCSKFVSLIHDSDLTYLINDTEAKYTILAPSDDVMSFFSGGDLPKRGSDEMKKMLQYHFMPGHYAPKKLKSGMLVETTLEEEGLGYKRQVLQVEAVDGDKEDSWKSLKFGGASVVREPVEVNNVLIYFISKPITPPSDALDTALPMLDYSSFVLALRSTSVGDIIKETPATTLLLPPNDAFKRLGLLVSKHLLTASNKPDLEKVLKHHTLATVQYGNALKDGKKHSFATLEDSDLTISRKDNGSIFISASGGWAGMKSELRPLNVLTQTGVIHELSDILIPRSLDLTIGKLVKAAEGSTMASLIVKAGFDWILNGTAPPDDSPWADQGLDGAGWTLLCPTDGAFEKFNLTELSADKERLTMLVSQHLIPSPGKDKKNKDKPLVADDPLNNNRPLLLDDSATYSTLQSGSAAYGDVTFRKDGEANGGYIVGIKNARGTDGRADWARVESWGRLTNGGSTGGVIQIDRLLVPYQPPYWREYGIPGAVGVIGVVLICGFFYMVRLVWRKDTTEATYEPVGGFARDDDEES